MAAPRVVRVARIPLVAVIGTLAVVSALYFARDIDFVVYWRGVRGFMCGARPLYGPNSGAGHPQEFRYPPVAVLFFLPLALLPMRVASVCWTLLGWAVCAWASAVAITKWRLAFSAGGAMFAVLVLAQPVWLAVRFGNVQPHLIALLVLAFLWSEEHPDRSGLALAVATCFKVWPLFFVPWFLGRRRRATLVYASVASAVLWIAPAFCFGWSRYAALLRSFFIHAVTIASDPETLWYSSQSLRGVLLRLLTRAVHPRDGYPDVSLAALPPAWVGGCCLLLTVLAYGYAVVAMWRSPASRRWLWDAAAFVFFSALQPFCMNSGLISLLPSVLAAAHVFSAPEGEYPKAARRALVLTCVLSAMALATFYRPFQRSALMWGIDFWMMLALGAALAIAARPARTQVSRPSQGAVATPPEARSL
jgi:hypothetical protein